MFPIKSLKINSVFPDPGVPTIAIKTHVEVSINSFISSGVIIRNQPSWINFKTKLKFNRNEIYLEKELWKCRSFVKLELLPFAQQKLLQTMTKIHCCKTSMIFFHCFSRYQQTLLSLSRQIHLLLLLFLTV